MYVPCTIIDVSVVTNGTRTRPVAAVMAPCSSATPTKILSWLIVLIFLLYSGSFFLERQLLHNDGYVVGGQATGSQEPIQVYKPVPVEDIVTWDEHSLFIHGKRVMIMSGEFHPWRLPVPSLWLDVFQKIKALGFNCVSFYVNWALVEGAPGNFTAEGVFAYEPFFEAASQAGVYLIAVRWNKHCENNSISNR